MSKFSLSDLAASPYRGTVFSVQTTQMRCCLLLPFLLWITQMDTLALYWAIQAGLLTPLTFARHRLSPLDAFTSGAYFLRYGRR